MLCLWLFPWPDAVITVIVATVVSSEGSSGIRDKEAGWEFPGVLVVRLTPAAWMQPLVWEISVRPGCYKVTH